MRNTCLFFLLFSIMAFTFPARKTKVWMIGDSTMSVKEVKFYPETGWGMPFAWFFDSTIEVDNRAKNGRSTRTFIEEGLWKLVEENLREGDYVFIQFGHNDEVASKKSYTTEAQFTANLERYINETRNKKGIPVLLTPVGRRKFDSLGRLENTHEVYANLVRMVAARQNVVLIDLDLKSRELIKQMGPVSSKLLFNYLTPGEHPNYPEGKSDDTHFSELGARKMAQIVLSELRNTKLELVNHIANPGVKK